MPFITPFNIEMGKFQFKKKQNLGKSRLESEEAESQQ
jgi:hypothetical protein